MHKSATRFREKENGMISKIKTLIYFLRDTNKTFSDLYIARQSTPKRVVIESKSTLPSLSGVALTAHIYYAEFIPKLFDLTKDWPRDSNLFLTTVSVELKNQIHQYFSDREFLLDVRVVPNIGRNFAPLLVEFSKTLLNFEYFIHVHSKKSSHSRKGIGAEWADRNFNLLLEPSQIKRALSIMNRSKNFGILFVDSKDLLRGLNFRWGQNRKIAKRLFGKESGFEKIRWSGPISFPAGGMFLARSASVQEILNFEWSYDLFPAERGQLDGTLQHAVERLFGELPLAKGLSQAIFLKESDRFYIENLDRF